MQRIYRHVETLFGEHESISIYTGSYAGGHPPYRMKEKASGNQTHVFVGMA